MGVTIIDDQNRGWLQILQDAHRHGIIIVTSIYVKPEFRRQGVGTALIDKLKLENKIIGLSMDPDVDRKEPVSIEALTEFYYVNGFQDTGDGTTLMWYPKGK